MKYMGSKRVMLQNGLGSLLREQLGRHSRFVDLFCGGSSVVWYAAEVGNVPIFAVDLQTYATTLACAVILRDQQADGPLLKTEFVDASRAAVRGHRLWRVAERLEHDKLDVRSWSRRSMTLCGGRESSGEIWRSYGGHYFSPVQSLAFDILLAHLPSDPARRAICLSSVIIAASQCAAAPGHTAQPFKATTRAAPFLREAWERDVFQYVDRAIEILSTKSAKVQGIARVGDATVIAKTLHEDDLVFVDPPYSGVHYSRFYHVLETIARGKCGPVDGVGRYPPAIERPVSAFSRKGQSAQALRSLLNSLAVSGCTCIFTFPSGQCSNGLSGDILLEIARESHRIRVKTVETKFSTLGGNNRHRHARRVSEELMLLLKPK